MGIIENGILGGFRNKTGAVIGSYWRSLDIIKGLPRISGKAPTQSQLDQRAKFILVNQFIQSFQTLIDVGYRSFSKRKTPINVAASYLLREAVVGESPNFAIDYSKVMFSQGKLKLPGTFSVVSNSPAALTFEWLNIANEEDKWRDNTDRLSVMVYAPELDDFLIIKNIIQRSAGAYTLSLPIEFSGKPSHIYCSFNSIQHAGLVSNSKYLGVIGIM